MLVAAVAVVVLVATVVWWFSRPPERGQAPSGHQVALPSGATAPQQASQPSIEDGPLPITLDSKCPDQTDPKLAASTDPRSAWVCPTQGVPFGQKLVATLPKPYVLTGIRFWPGFQGKGPDGGDEWFRHGLIDEAQLVCNDPDRTPVTLSPQGQRHVFAQPLNHIVASAVELTILASSAPPPPPATTPTTAPPGAEATDDSADEAAGPDVSVLFPAPGSNDDQANNPNAASVAVWGFELIGHPIP
ncbi:hypothetical protein E2F47_25045 [Mycobacterium eburneum]|nr:hypothetical protein [Mycobacterium eburneum]TDH48134.1 hypothetical protein E2F47_25045 [Mycobacterium eburneum]